MTLRAWGPFSLFGLAVAAIALGIDQAFKWWMLQVVDFAARGKLEVTPFFDLLLVWNRGISYGLLPNLGAWPLVAIQVLVSVFMVLWLAGADNRFRALAAGLIIGGALGNITDRLRFGAVADFFHFHIGSYSWYVFNLADVAIVAGAAFLVYDSFRHQPRKNG